MTIAKAHHYAIDAATLLETCLTRLRETIALDKRKRRQSLVNMEGILVTTERLLLAYICQQIDLEREAASEDVHLNEEDSEHEVPPTLMECIEIFRSVLEAKKQRDMRLHEARCVARGSSRRNHASVSFVSDLIPSGERTGEQKQVMHLQTSNNGNKRPAFDNSRSPVDSLLFRLIVALQLCLVRIDDAHFVITGHRHRQHQGTVSNSSMTLFKVGVASTVCVIGIGSLWMLRSKPSKHTAAPTRGMLQLSGKMAFVAFTGKILVREWGNMWLTAKIEKSTAVVEVWQQQWLLVQITGVQRGSVTAPDAKSQRLIEYAMSHSPKVSECMIVILFFKYIKRIFVFCSCNLTYLIHQFSHHCGIRREKFVSCFLNEPWISCMLPWVLQSRQQRVKQQRKERESVGGCQLRPPLPHRTIRSLTPVNEPRKQCRRHPWT